MRFKFLDVKGVSPFFLISVMWFGGIVTLGSIDDHRESLKLIWSFSEAADRMVGKDDISARVAARFKLNVSIW
jgi:hypothetical protein